jgi:prepilin-type N-terminal cleavage/methylation domain-containing protein
LIAEPHVRRDRGFTLPELLVTIVMMGLIVASLAAAFTSIVRTSPSSEARVDDSRALLNLTNWISQDVSSTDVNGFAVGDAASGCSGVPTSDGLMELHWSEGSTTYVANYRYVSNGTGVGVIHRYTCLLGGPAQDLRLTPDLQNVSSGALAPAPVAISLVPNPGGGNKGVQFVVTVTDESGVQRELLSHDATTTNIHSTLPPASGGPGNTNHPPVALPGTTSVTVGGSVSYPLPVSDSDGDVLFTALSDIPAGWNVTAIGTVVTITPDLLVVPGSYSFTYTVNDPSNATDTETVAVTVSAVVGNNAPTASPATTTATRDVPVTVALPATDVEDGSNLTVALSNVPAQLTATTSGLNVTVTPGTGASGSYAFTYTVTDTAGASATSTVTVNVCTVSAMTIATPVAVHTSGQNAGNLKQNVAVSITTNGYCGGALVLAFKPKAADAVETTIQFGTATSLTIEKSAYLWDIVTRDVTLNVRQGANGTVERSGILRVTA